MRFSPVLAVLASSIALLPPVKASAHPHVFVDPKLQITATADGHLQSLENIWWMDELFSSGVVVDFDKNGNGTLEKEELEAIGKQVASSIVEWSFYTFVKKGGVAVEMLPPDRLDVSFDPKRSRLLFEFAMKPKAPLDLKSSDVVFSNFDETYFVAFDFRGPQDFVVRNMPKGCRPDIDAASPDEAAKSWMDTIAALPADASVPADGIKFSQTLSTKFRIVCGKG